MAAGLLEQAQKEELQLDAQLKSLENLDEDDYEVIRQKRLISLQKKARQEQDWRQLGHGRHSAFMASFFALFHSDPVIFLI